MVGAARMSDEEGILRARPLSSTRTIFGVAESADGGGD